MSVIDIRSVNLSEIASNTMFILDANVLYWLYSGYSLVPEDKSYQDSVDYSKFIGQLLSAGHQLGALIGNVQELLNIIERTEYNIYARTGGTLTNKKQFRSDPAERNKVQEKCSAVYRLIKSNCTLFDLSLTITDMDLFIDNMHMHTYDPIDFFVAENLNRSSRINYITNDPDFRSDDRLNVYTVV